MQNSLHRRLWARPQLLAAILMATGVGTFITTQAAAQTAAGAAPEAHALLAQADTPANAASTAENAQPARWTKKKIFFIYEGIMTTYSCEGLTEDVRHVLLELGARKSDMDVRETGCPGVFNAQSQHPAVAGTFYVLEPVPSEQPESPSAAAGTVDAHWQPVTVDLAKPGRNVNGQCELLEQFKARVLPLFATRDVKYESTCSPRQEIVGGTSLRVKVLMPDRAG